MSVSLMIDTSDIQDGELIDEADVTLPIADLQSALEDTLNGIQPFDRILLGTPQSLTINVGIVTVTKSYIQLATEGGASTDDLDRILGYAEGRILFVTNPSGHTVVLKHGTGNIFTADGLDCSLNSIYKWALLLYNNGGWLVLASGGSASSGISYPDILKAQVFS